MVKLSCILPSYKDPLLIKTIDDLLLNSELGDQLEIIAVFDGKLTIVSKVPPAVPAMVSILCSISLINNSYKNLYRNHLLHFVFALIFHLMVNLEFVYQKNILN